MRRSEVELRPTLDREWLDAAALDDPVTHAYAVWDLDRFPARVRFVSALRAGQTLGYLLFWPLPTGATVVHWTAPSDLAPWLVPSLPVRPVVVVGPPEIRDAVAEARGPTREYRIWIEAAPAGFVPPTTPHDGAVRPLMVGDRDRLVALASGQDDRLGTTYASIDPGSVPVWGGFDEGRLVAVANASVQLPRIWIVSGVFVLPSERRRGWGRSVVRAVMASAAAAGAACALYVPETRAPARGLYRELGFQAVAERCWMDAGAEWPP